ncbi:phage GP46 family protein [Terasakiella sp. A23]|uniref:phage GP46 family protein n=1 Tax=Terasakiella sp. FCG-A23 TaxID=3080561 RepID=UPI002955C094|nr:phage GP46 family protein [Terasakiella sp. A23]MDV7340965.1 phage GP46 family protein [Terasakiella sp. A23]
MDFAMINTSSGAFDFETDGTDLVISEGLLEAVINSIGRDGLAPEGLLPTGEDRKGHWSSALTDEEKPADGSLIWTLRQRKITAQLPYEVSEMLENCCAWMVNDEDGVAASVSKVRAACEKASRRGRLDAELILYLKESDEQRRFSILFDLQNNKYFIKELD